MYKIIDCEQRSEAWFQARLGLHTMSFADKLITAVTGKRSTSADDVINRLVAEKVMGQPDETFQSDAMLRGKELEDEALRYINFTHGLDFKPIGFLDSGKGYGCSPDALDLTNSMGLELKCPSAHTHIEYISAGCLPNKYRAQVQGSLLVTGFKQWIFVSYHPDIKPLFVVVERDQKFIDSLYEILVDNCKEVERRHKLVTEYIEA